MKEAMVIFKKQMRDTLKNKEILIQFILLPLMAVIMENTVVIDGMPEHYFVKLFSVMYVGMAPLLSTAAIIAEEKEKGTLRVLFMSDVKPFQYLLGVGGYVWLLCMCGSGIMAAVAGIGGGELIVWLGAMGAALAVSVVTGAALGMLARNQMTATSLGMPVMMVLAFLPMLALFHDTARRVARIFYTGQLQLWLDGPGGEGATYQGALIVLCNMAAVCALFAIAYRRNGLEQG